MWDKKLWCGLVSDKNFSFYHVPYLQFVMSLKQFYKLNTAQLKLFCLVLHFLTNQTHPPIKYQNLEEVNRVSWFLKESVIWKTFNRYLWKACAIWIQLYYKKLRSVTLHIIKWLLRYLNLRLKIRLRLACASLYVAYSALWHFG